MKRGRRGFNWEKLDPLLCQCHARGLSQRETARVLEVSQQVVSLRSRKIGVIYPSRRNRFAQPASMLLSRDAQPGRQLADPAAAGTFLSGEMTGHCESDDTRSDCKHQLNNETASRYDGIQGSVRE